MLKGAKNASLIFTLVFPEDAKRYLNIIAYYMMIRQD